MRLLRWHHTKLPNLPPAFLPPLISPSPHTYTYTLAYTHAAQHRVGSKYTTDVKHILRFYTFVPARGHHADTDALQCVAVADSPAFAVYSRRNGVGQKLLAAGDTKASSSSSPSTAKVECRKSAAGVAGKRRGAPGANMRSSVGANRRPAADKKRRSRGRASNPGSSCATAPVAVASAATILAPPPAAMNHEPSMRWTNEMTSTMMHGLPPDSSPFTSTALLTMHLHQQLCRQPQLEQLQQQMEQQQQQPQQQSEQSPSMPQREEQCAAEEEMDEFATAAAIRLLFATTAATSEVATTTFIPPDIGTGSDALEKLPALDDDSLFNLGDASSFW